MTHRDINARSVTLRVDGAPVILTSERLTQADVSGDQGSRVITADHGSGRLPCSDHVRIQPNSDASPDANRDRRPFVTVVCLAQLSHGERKTGE